ncbi:HvfC/BufC family peptide modification chaperone [Burkholderia stagnalis]
MHPPPRSTRRHGGAGALPDLGARQADFAAAILHADRPLPPGLTGPDGAAGSRRFAVYRNNVIAGLADALRAAFPATCRIVGDAFFAAMAGAYASRHPPPSPVMLAYGADFAAFVGRFEPAASLPYLRDVARLERAWAEAYHAGEAAPLAPAAFAGIAPDRLPSIALVPHPSVRIVRSAFPVVSLWRMNVAGGMPAALDVDAGGEDAFVVRPAADVEVRTLPPGAAVFIESVIAGARMVDAVDAALADDRRFDLAGTLTALLDAGAVVGWRPADRARSDHSSRSA